MFIYPNINPIALQLGPIKIHWYGLMYLFGFVMAWWYCLRKIKQSDVIFNKEQVGDIIFYAACGVIIGGRVGYMLFYDFPTLVANPLSLFTVWKGGMSFHGGLLGVIIALYLLARRYQCSIWRLTDFIAPIVPIGLAAGRLGNFINGELWGRVTSSQLPWAMIYPQAGMLPRHPSEIYEFLAEGVCLFLVLWFFSKKTRPMMAVSSVFLLGYGIARFTCEFFRQPDPQLGFIYDGWLTMGQLLSLPMILIGIGLLIYSYHRKES